MDKHLWNKIDKNTNKPSPRWGHTCCVIEQDVVFFGGYADSNYMNDMWTYNSTTMKWNQIITTGQRPTHRSNCSMNYDPDTERIVIFGGGGPNKQRFNTVNILDWKTKVWTELSPKQNEEGPWQRTYHIAELKYPYLVVYGGQGVTDMDDLWVYHFQTMRWTEVKMGKDQVKPCARRFHSSCLINNQIFVIAGCYGKYRCLSDVYSLDITPLLETGDTRELKWVQRKLKGSSFLSRWGHSTAVYDNKIYVFAGRFSNDLNDLLVIDVQNNSIKALKITGNPQQYPKPRRRHCAGFVGSCMIAFGGFNGEYFNDLHYINVFQLNNKVQIQTVQEKQSSHVFRQQFSDYIIQSKNGTPFHLHTAILSKHFKSQNSLKQYLQEINNKYSQEELQQILRVLYKGYGKINFDQIHQKYQLSIPENLNRRHCISKLLDSDQNERNILKLAVQTSEKCSDHVIELKHHEFKCFLQNRSNHWSCEDSLIINQNEVKVNKTLLSMQSIYFKNIFRCHSYTQPQNRLELLNYDRLIFQILVNYLMLGVMVVPNDFVLQDWMKMSELSEYLCLNGVKSICQNQLCLRVNSNNLEKLCKFAQQLDFKNLSLHCANFQIKNEESLQAMYKKRYQGKGIKSAFLKLFKILRFDLQHSKSKNILEKEYGVLKGESQSNIEEKQNNREYNNA